MFGSIAGAISSLCVSSLILLTEKVIGIPVGTFYLIIIDALLHSSSTSVSDVTYGSILHLVTGTLLKFIIAIPFLRNKQYFLKLTKYSELYGSIFGFIIWTIFFVPISLMVVLSEISQIRIGYITAETYRFYIWYKYKQLTSNGLGNYSSCASL